MCTDSPGVTGAGLEQLIESTSLQTEEDSVLTVIGSHFVDKGSSLHPLPGMYANGLSSKGSQVMCRSWVCKRSHALTPSF